MRRNTRTTRQRISLEELMALPVRFWAVPSPDGRMIAYVSNESGRPELHLLDMKTDKSSQLTHGAYPETPSTFHAWSPDSKFVFLSKDPIPGNEKNNIFRVSVPDGKVLQLTDTPECRDDICEASHYGEWILFASDRSHGITQLFRMRPDGGSVQQLTNHSRPVRSWEGCRISPDDEWIAYSATESDNLQNRDIWVVKIDGTERRRVLSIRDGSKELVRAWSNDSSMILFTSDYSGVDQAGVCFVDSGEVKWFGLGRAPETAVDFVGKSKKVVVVRDVDAENKLILYDLDSGRERPLQLPPGHTEARYTTMDGKCLIIEHQDSIHRMRFLLYDLIKHSFKEIVPSEFGRYTPDDFHPDEYISYPSGDVTVHAVLYKPRELQPGKKLPAIVMPHGGPTDQYMRAFMEDAQVLTDHGYVLLLPNVRGSTGYGTEFRDACLDDWGGKDLDDIEAGVRYLKSLPYVNSERIGIHGASYGGFMTYLAVTKKPSLWRAASAWMGVTSLPKMYEKTKQTYPELALWLEEQMGKPDNPATIELWEDRSAISFAENMTAKLQIIHGENDPRCPIDQAENFRNRLLEIGRKEGEDFEYVVLADEGHGSFEASQLVRRMQHVVDFFDRTL